MHMSLGQPLQTVKVSGKKPFLDEYDTNEHLNDDEKLVYSPIDLYDKIEEMLEGKPRKPGKEWKRAFNLLVEEYNSFAGRQIFLPV